MEGLGQAYLRPVTGDGITLRYVPLSSKYGTYKTVKARFWPWISVLKTCEVVPSSSGSGFPLKGPSLVGVRADVHRHARPLHARLP